MIKMAQAKLAAYPQVRYILGDFAAIEGEYDAVISSLALHHLVTDDDKRCFYRRIYESLNPGGVFYNADVVLASGEVPQDMYIKK